MLYKLMVKTHDITGLHYLCITKRKKWEEYTGSGTYWKRHLNKHGKTFSTLLLFESDDYEDFCDVAAWYSITLDVVKSEEWANLTDELGYDDALLYWQLHASAEEKQAMYDRRAITLKENHWTKDSEKRSIVIEKISDALSLRWNTLTVEQQNKQLQPLFDGRDKFLSDKTSPKYIKWCSDVAKATKLRMENTPFEVLSERSRKHRLNLSDEKKAARKEKIQAVWATGVHDHIFEKMSRERQGSNNPAAKLLIWDGVEYTKTAFEIYRINQKLTKRFVEDMFNSNNDNYQKLYSDNTIVYDNITCPHCNKGSEKKPSAFKRWHFDNCKEKAL